MSGWCVSDVVQRTQTVKQQRCHNSPVESCRAEPSACFHTALQSDFRTLICCTVMIKNHNGLDAFYSMRRLKGECVFIISPWRICMVWTLNPCSNSMRPHLHSVRFSCVAFKTLLQIFFTEKKYHFRCMAEWTTQKHNFIHHLDA